MSITYEHLKIPKLDEKNQLIMITGYLPGIFVGAGFVLAGALSISRAVYRRPPARRKLMFQRVTGSFLSFLEF